MELLAELRTRLGTAIILISHDLGLAASYADDVIVMYAGRAVEYAPTRILFAQMRMPYTRALLDAIPRLERRLARAAAGHPRAAAGPHGVAAGLPVRAAVRAGAARAAGTAGRRSSSTRSATGGPAGTPARTVSPYDRACWRCATSCTSSPCAAWAGRQGRHRTRRLRRLVRPRRRGDPRRRRRDRLGQVDAGPMRGAGPASQVRLGAVPGHRAGGPAGAPAATRPA